jgi:hypothetical protein
MYRVRFFRTIFSRQQSDPRLHELPFALAQKVSSLPFPPFLGLRVRSRSGIADRITRVTPYVEDGQECFICEVDDRYPCEGSTGGANISYDDLKAMALNTGWEVSEMTSDNRLFMQERYPSREIAK